MDSSGRRNSISESDFLLHIKKGASLLEGNTRILQRTSVSSDSDNYRIELIHDSFCAPLEKLKLKRQKQRQIAYTIGFIIAFGVVVVLVQTWYNSESHINQLNAQISKLENNLEIEKKTSEKERKEKDINRNAYQKEEKINKDSIKKLQDSIEIFKKEIPTAKEKLRAYVFNQFDSIKTDLNNLKKGYENIPFEKEKFIKAFPQYMKEYQDKHVGAYEWYRGRWIERNASNAKKTNEINAQIDNLLNGLRGTVMPQIIPKKNKETPRN